MSDTFIYLHLYTIQTSGRSLKQEGVYVTSFSIEHTITDLFFEETCLQVIWVWNIVISFRLWVIYDDVEVLWIIDYIDVYILTYALDESS